MHFIRLNMEFLSSYEHGVFKFLVLLTSHISYANAKKYHFIVITKIRTNFFLKFEGIVCF